MWTQMMPALRMTLWLTLVTGLIYPGIVTGLCQGLFGWRANGSLVTRAGKVVGSELIGQGFSRAEYFHGRLSAAGAEGWDASASGGSNLGPTSQKLIDRVKGSVETLRKENPSQQGSWPVDAVTTSGSGLDPHVSPATALLQVARVAKARGVEESAVRQIVEQATEGRDLGFLGEPRINILRLNLRLDERFPPKS